MMMTSAIAFGKERLNLTRNAKDEISNRILRLAEKYKLSQQYEEAISLFQLCIDRATNSPKAISHIALMVGDCYELLGMNK